MIEQFFNDLRQQGVKLWLSGESLKFKTYQHAPLSKEQIGFLKENKPKVIEWLGQNPNFFSHLPLSENQKSLWLAYQLDPTSAAYNLTHAERLNSSINIDVLKQSYQILFDRHPILRAGYFDENGVSLQRVISDNELPFYIENVQNWSKAEVKQWTEQEADKPLVLEKGAVCRAQLLVNQKGTVAATETETVLQITVHHIAADFWSCELIFDELLNIYKKLSVDPNAFNTDEEVVHDYFSWSAEQSQWLTSADAEKARSFWRDTVKGCEQSLDLPTDFSRPALQTFNGELIAFEFPEHINQALREQAKSLGVTPYVFCLSVYQLLLYRYSGQRQFLIGTPASGRLKQEYQRTIGYLVNPILLACNCGNNPTFRSFIDSVKNHSRAALEQQTFPYNQVLQDLNIARDPSRNPLFQHMFTLTHVHENAHKDLAEFTYLSEQRGAALDISLVLLDDRKQFRGEWHYNCDLYTPETAQMMIDSYLEIINAVCANPDVSVDTVEIVPEALREKMLVQWNQSNVDLSEFADVISQFEKQVNNNPEQIAAVFEGEQLTYTELDQKANQLAHFIRAKDIGPEDKIIICQQRSLSMLVSLLAVLKAGAAYVPVDPAYPQDRVAFMLEDANAQLVLADKRIYNTEHASKIDESKLVIVDEQNFSEFDTSALPLLKNSAEHLAYMIYTSGSTGKPKAVQVTRHNMLNFLVAMDELFHLSDQDRLLAVTSLSFDIAVLELFLPLMSGAQVIIGNEDLVRDGEALKASIAKHNVTIMQATPVSWKILLAVGWQQSSAFKILCGGEAFPSEIAQQLLRQESVEIWNVYGPTETTVWSSAYRLNAENSYTNVPIGKPVANTQLYILDANFNPLPVGVAGELLIGGDGVTRGYLGRPELTADRFVETKYGRLYRTGDLARFNHDGIIECLGRLDHQVKVRGYRIELGEIETCLTDFEHVKDAVVHNYTANDETQLAAYVIANEPLASSNNAQAQIKSFVGQFLPEYMVPANIIVMDSFPLTPNGKVDRKALPIPNAVSTRTEYIAPESDLEKAICEIWQNVLDVDQIGMNDNFFQLGGHSLKATRVITQIKQQLELDVPLKLFFTAQTPADLVNQLNSVQSSGIKILPVSRQEKLLPSFGQQRLWLLNQIEQGSEQHHISGLLRLEGDLNTGALKYALNQILLRHESLRTYFRQENESLFQVVQEKSIDDISVEDLSDLTSSNQASEIDQKTRDFIATPFDLSSDLMVRVKLLKVSENDHLMIVVMHHIAADGWSLAVFIRDFKEFYQAFIEQRTSELPQLAIQYADYAQWQQSQLNGELLDNQLDYWSSKLASLPIVHNIPLDYSRPPTQSFVGDIHTSQFNSELASRLRSYCNQQNVTLFMGLHAAFSALISRYSNESDIVIGTPIANREQAEVADLVGLFINMLVLRSDVADDINYQDLLSQSRSTLLDAYAHQQVPFEQLVDSLKPERSTSHSPLFQVMLILQNNEQEALELPGLTLSLQDLPVEKVQYDLTLEILDSGDELTLRWLYSTALFKPETISQLAKHFECLLAGLLNEPNKQIAAVDLLDANESKQQLAQFNQTDADYSKDHSFENLLARQVASNPNKVAARFNHQTMTYKALDEKSNALARYLLKEGVQPDQRIVVCQRRSLSMLVSLLGILKAGVAYVPVDPSYPADRVEYMLTDSDTDIILSDTNVISTGLFSNFTAGADSDKTIVNIDELISADGVLSPEKSLHSASIENSVSLENNASPDNLAYLIYTSGSTGKPKAVQISRANMLNFLCAMRDLLTPTENDRLLAVTSLSFDIAVLELYLPLICGAEVVIADETLASDGHGLKDAINAHDITFMQATPVSWKILLAADWQQTNAFTALCGGEAFPGELAKQLLDQSGLTVWNVYGPTETTVWSSAYKLDSNKRDDYFSIPIGQPIANTQIYILDKHNKLVPSGVAGELCIGGDGLSRGYLGRPDLTEDRFIQSDFGRIYRTGDLARRHSDGTLECLGRLDHQVKVRGFRIELGEIETAIVAHEAVKDAVVHVQEMQGEATLIAYVIAEHSATESSVTEQAEFSMLLKTYLNEFLPDYMVPNIIMFLEELPLTPNGKVDRKALPAPDVSLNQTEYVAPTTDVEKELCAIWQELLDVEKVGVNDNFFKLGGNSLLAARMVAKFKERFHVDLPLHNLFGLSSLSELAALIEQQQPAITEEAFNRMDDLLDELGV
ncbi:amino acid adenylation domain-containing protein [Sessilibacter corallicola]|uniref:Non-ribosomal peptide synthetase n=1 Tax=Sessilibacter corallicola TaxID=2904075 RepID=A0ABQ0ACF3_9GAMM